MLAPQLVLSHTTIKWELEKVTLGRCCDYISDSPQSVPASGTFFYAKVPSKEIIPQDLGDRMALLCFLSEMVVVV